MLLLQLHLLAQLLVETLQAQVGDLESQREEQAKQVEALREEVLRLQEIELEKMRAELQVQEAKEQMKALGKDVGDEIINMKEEERQKLIKDQRDKQRKAEQNEARPAYERQSMHGQKIAISVGPSSLPDTCRTTWSAIPHKNTNWK